MTYRVLSEVLYHPPIEQLRRSETPPPIPRTSPGVPGVSLLLNRDFFRLEFVEGEQRGAGGSDEEWVPARTDEAGPKISTDRECTDEDS